MRIIRLMSLLGLAAVLSACGDDPAPSAPATQAAPAVAAPQAAPTGSGAATDYSTGGVTVQILPENPTSSDCVNVVIQGVPGRAAIVWLVNDQHALSGTQSQLCGDSFRRGDRVTVNVGTRDQGAAATVMIGNSLPRVVGMTATPDGVHAGTTITVEPQVEDPDGDTITYRYQWLINGQPDSLLIDPFLPGEKVVRGDRLQLQIIPNDGYGDGPVYMSYEMQVPNAPPRITSLPPETITSLDYRYQVEVADPDDSAFTYRLAAAPEGMRIGETTGLIEWSLAGVAPGEYTIAIVVADPAGLETAQEYRLALSKQ